MEERLKCIIASGGGGGGGGKRNTTDLPRSSLDREINIFTTFTKKFILYYIKIVRKTLFCIFLLKVSI